MIQRGDVLGIVQIQSRAQIQVLLRIRVEKIQDLIIQVALIRPGPIQGGAVHPYIARCLGQEDVTYDHPSLRACAGRDEGGVRIPGAGHPGGNGGCRFQQLQADGLRRAMSRKRSQDEMEKHRQDFLTGAPTRGVDAADCLDESTTRSSPSLPSAFPSHMPPRWR